MISVGFGGKSKVCVLNFGHLLRQGPSRLLIKHTNKTPFGAHLDWPLLIRRPHRGGRYHLCHQQLQTSSPERKPPGSSEHHNHHLCCCFHRLVGGPVLVSCFVSHFTTPAVWCGEEGRQCRVEPTKLCFWSPTGGCHVENDALRVLSYNESPKLLP